MTDESWTGKMERVAQALWQLLRAHPEVQYVRAEVTLDVAHQNEVLATDVAGGVLWIDAAGTDTNRQVLMPDGTSARHTSN